MFSQAFERVIRGELTPTELRRELALSSATFYRYRQVYFYGAYDKRKQKTCRINAAGNEKKLQSFRCHDRQELTVS